MTDGLLDSHLNTRALRHRNHINQTTLQKQQPKNKNMEPTAKDALDLQVNELIALLDHYNFLKGSTLFTHPNRPSTTLPPLPIDGTPIAIQMNTTPSLSTHLSAQTAGLQTQKRLAETIRLRLATHPEATPGTHAHLNSEFNHLLLPRQQNSPLTTAAFAQLTNLPEKLAILRTLQHHRRRASEPPYSARPPEFVTNLVADVDSAGRPSPLLRIWLPVGIDWFSYTQALAMSTYHRWSDDGEDGHGECLKGYADRYTLRDGGWVYQRTSNSGQVEGKLRELKCEGDFEGRREGAAAAAVGEWQGGALVWHVSWMLDVSPELSSGG